MVIVEDLLMRVAAILFVAFLAHTAIAQTTVPFTFDRLENLMKANHVGTVENFIHILPDSYKKNPVLMVESHSRQTGTEEHPRVILFGDAKMVDSAAPGKNNDRLYIAFQTDTSEKSRLPKNIEIIEWNYFSRQYTFHSLDFDGVTYHPQDTQVCARCHGDPGRPNWTAYNDWPGTFANRHTFGPKDKSNSHTLEEANTYIDTLKKNNTRLAEIDLSSYTTPFLNVPTYPSDETPAALTLKIEDQMVFRDVSYIFKTPDFQKYKFAFAGAFLKCTDFDSFFPADLLNTLKAGALNNLKTNPVPPSQMPQSENALSFQKMEELTAPFLQHYVRYPEYYEEVNTTSWLRFLFEGRGLDSILKNILGSPPVENTNDPRWNYDFVGLGPGQRVAGDLSYEFFKEIADDKAIGSMALLDYNAGNDEAQVSSAGKSFRTSDIPSTAAICKDFAAKSLNSLNHL